MQVQTLILFAASLVLLSPSTQSVSAQTVNCPAAPVSRLTQQHYAQVTPGLPDNLRAEPTVNSGVLTEVPAGAIVNIVDGPICADNIAWWHVRYLDFTGWIAEGAGTTYYIAPYVPPVTTFEITDPAKKTVDVNYNNISLTYNGVFGSKIEAQIIPFQPKVDAVYGIGAPAHISFTIPVNGLDYPPNIAIYPINEYGQINDMARQQIVKLRQLLKDRSLVIDITTQIPAVPTVNAGQVFHSNISYLNFKSGSGIRFLTLYAQYPAAITNEGLRYMFQGLTSDGKYVVSASLFPISSPLLLNTQKEAERDPSEYKTLETTDNGYTKYLSQTAAKLNAASGSNFTPNVDQLDQLIQSLEVR